MSIGPKQPKPKPADEKRAYATATRRDRNRCVRCGKRGIERDHRKNRSQGGLTVASNLQGLCPEDHLWKTQNPAQAVIDGFAVPGWARPELWPGYRHKVGWVIYFDAPDVDGNWWQTISEDTAEFIMSNGGRA